MARHNHNDIKDMTKGNSCRRCYSPDFVNTVAKSIVTKLMIEQKYRDPKYSAKRLAEDIGINQRHVSAIMKLRFQRNYAQMVSEMRVHEAMYMLQDEHFINMTMEDIAINTGFSTRQSFYAAFYRMTRQTPLDYRQIHISPANWHGLDEETNEV